MEKTENFTKLEETIGYSFKNKEIIKTALTHSSFANENKIKSNERLEFLGDSVLQIVVAEYLFKNYNHLPEGELTKIRASLVCEKALSDFAKEINLGQYLFLGKGEINTGGRTRESLIADAFEAVLAAIYLDSSMKEAKKFILKFVKKCITSNHPSFTDYKTMLQEIIQQNKEEKVKYILKSEQGPDHDKKFEVDIFLNSNILATGVGKSKKEAEQDAAKKVLELMGRI